MDIMLFLSKVNANPAFQNKGAGKQQEAISLCIAQTLLQLPLEAFFSFRIMKLVLFETTLDFRVFFSSFNALLIPCFLYNSNFWQVFWSLLLNMIPYTKVWKLFQFCKTITVLRFLWRHQSYLNFSTCTIFTMTMYFWRHLPLYQVVQRKWENEKFELWCSQSQQFLGRGWSNIKRLIRQWFQQVRK